MTFNPFTGEAGLYIFFYSETVFFLKELQGLLFWQQVLAGVAVFARKIVFF